jgi:putative ABC transport system ATP-binding protein
MLLFSQLNTDGRTIVLITHEEEVAACAKRTIQLRDGLVISDERTTPVHGQPPMLRNAELMGSI